MTEDNTKTRSKTNLTTLLVAYNLGRIVRETAWGIMNLAKND